MSILNVNKINPVGGGSTITIAGIASVTNNISVGNSVTAGSFVGPIEGNVTGNVTGNADTASGLSGNASINTTGIVTATSFVPTVGQLSHRNIIINGDFRIAQRGSSSTSNGYQTVDRWAHYTGSSGVTATFSQQSTSSSDTPYQNGFSNFFRTALSGAGTANAGAYFELMQTIEAQDIANSGWNFKSSSSYITLSFWVRPSTNQTFYGYLRSYDSAAYVYAFSFTASGNNTWTKITKTIAGNSNLQFDNNNGHGLLLMLTPFFGTDYTNNRTLNTWNAMDSTNYFPDMASTWLTAGASTFDVTGVQLEVGPVATPFEHRSAGDEFARCQRYYQQYVNISAVGYVPNNSSRTYSHGFFFPVEMRAAPTMSITNTGSSNGQYITDGDTNRYVSSVLSQGSKTTHMSVSFNISGDLSDYRGAYLFGTGNTSYQTTYKLNAEL